jgi:alpha-galactosidase
MVDLDSDLARAHPDWILGDPAGEALTWRHQHVLNLTSADAWDHLRARIDDVVTASGVDFIKWDHNRDLHAATDRASGASVVHGQTLAVYRLMDALRTAHPHLEIESCASGGARIDLGIMQHAQRVWASDTNDPIERQLIQRGTGMLLPPELIGAHVGPEEAHTTSRSTALSFRLATALFWHAGIEWDLNACSDDELQALQRWAGLYRELRPLLHSGTTLHGDDPDEGTLLSGVVSDDRSHAVFSWARIATGGASSTSRVRLPGLDEHARYEVRIRDEVGAAHLRLVEPPSWFPAPGRPATVSGRVLTELGVPLPLLDPGNALILELRHVEGDRID